MTRTFTASDYDSVQSKGISVVPDHTFPGFHITGHKHLISVRVGDGCYEEFGGPIAQFGIGRSEQYPLYAGAMGKNQTVMVHTLSEAGIRVLSTNCLWLQLEDVKQLEKAMTVIGLEPALQTPILAMAKDVQERHEKRTNGYTRPNNELRTLKRVSDALTMAGCPTDRAREFAEETLATIKAYNLAASTPHP